MEEKEGSQNKDVKKSVKEKDTIVRQISIFGEIFSGPIPPPKILEAFEKVLPGAGDRIFKIAEREQLHQHKLNKLDRILPFINVLFGQIIGFLLGAGLIGGGVFLLYHDKNVAGFSSLITGLVSLILPLILRRKLLDDDSKSSKSTNKITT
jgi:uncharacterized membrane protein